MGYDLYARNKTMPNLHARGWTWLLDAGAGLPFSHGAGYKPAMYVYRRWQEATLASNDGFRVNAKQAKQMAMLALWIADYQDALYEEWMKEPEPERHRMSKDYSGIFNPPVRRDFVEFAREFAEWAKKSGGFRVW